MATTATASRTGTRIWYRLALIYFIVAVTIGVAMGVSENHAMFPVHAHLNLLGWVSLALSGLIYDRFPAAVDTSLYRIHFWLYNLAVPVLMVAVALILSGNAAMGPVAGIASIAVLVAIVIFTVNVWRNSGG